MDLLLCSSILTMTVASCLGYPAFKEDASLVHKFIDKVNVITLCTVLFTRLL